jgi:flagellar protein FliS
MYAPASPFSRPIPGGERSMSGLYRQVGVETSISGASPHQLVKLLFEGYFDALAKARGGLRNKDLGAKAEALTRALRIVDEGLKAALDLNAGGEIAQNLHALYTYISLRLTQANLKNDEAILDECQSLMEPIRDAWLNIAPAQAQAARAASMEVQA